MILQIRVENFKSFKDETVFSFLTEDLELPAHIPAHPAHIRTIDGMQFSRCAAIYGANAGGKSNLFDVFEFFRGLASPVGSSIHNISFASDPDHETSLSLLIFIENLYYEYEIVIQSGNVINESLYISEKLTDEPEMIFEYTPEKLELNYEKLELSDDEERKKINYPLWDKVLNSAKFYKFTILGAAGDRNISYIVTLQSNLLRAIFTHRPKYSYLSHSLYLFTENEKFKKMTNDFLKIADFGIRSLDEIMNKIPEESLSHGEKMALKSGIPLSKGSYRDDPILRHYNKKADQYNEVSFAFNHEGSFQLPVRDESDGTLRMLELLYFIWQLTENEDVTVVIDELDLHLHTSLCRAIIEFVANNGKGQLIFTTHDTNLIDLRILRMDEIWFVGKDNQGVSRLSNLYQYRKHLKYKNKDGYDIIPDVEYAYLVGGFGAIPYISNLSKLINKK